MSCFEPFKKTFRKEQDNLMVKNNHCELEKCTLVRWVDKALEHAPTKNNIKNGFKDKGIWPFNPKVMDDNIKPTGFNISNDDIIDSDNAVYEHQWGENGATTQLLNILIKEILE